MRRLFGLLALAGATVFCACNDDETIPESPTPAVVALTSDATIVPLTRNNGTATFTVFKDEASAAKAASAKIVVDDSYAPASNEVVIPATDNNYSLDIDTFVFTEKEHAAKVGTVVFPVERIAGLAAENPSAQFFVLPLMLTAEDELTTIDADRSSIVLKVTYDQPLPTLALTTDATEKLLLTSNHLTVSFTVGYAPDTDNADLAATARVEPMSAAELPGLEVLDAAAYTVAPTEFSLSADCTAISGSVTFDIAKAAEAWSVGKELSVALKLTSADALVADDARSVVFTISGVSELEALAFTLEKQVLYTDNYTAALDENARFISEYTYSYRISTEENGEAISGLAPVTFDKPIDKFVINTYLTDAVAEAAGIEAGQKLWFISEAADGSGSKDTKSLDFVYGKRDLKIALTSDMISNPLEYLDQQDGKARLGSVAYLVDGDELTIWQPVNTYRDMSADERKSKYGWDGTTPVCYPYYTKLSSEFAAKFPGYENFDYTAGPNAGVWLDFTLPAGVSTFRFGYQTRSNFWNGFPCGIRIYAKASEDGAWEQVGPAYAVPSQADGGKITSARNSDYAAAVKTLPANPNNNSQNGQKWTSEDIAIEGGACRYIRVLITETVNGGNQAQVEQPGWYNLKENKADGIWRTSGYNSCLSEVWLYGE